MSGDPSTVDITRLRDCALVATLFYSGVRIGEAFRLWPHDVDPQSGSIFVSAGIGEPRRPVVMMQPGWPYLMQWLERRADLELLANAPVFCAIEGTALSVGYACALLERVADIAGFSRRTVSTKAPTASPHVSEGG